MQLVPVILIALVTISVRPAAAHCDSVDGPVVKAARAAFESGDVRGALAWVQPDDEAAVRAAFDRASAVGKLGGDARSLAETFFSETVVRLHRAGEGASYTGLKPAGGVSPAVAAAERALAEGSVEALAKEAGHELRHRLERVRKAPQGREYVKAYVEFVHYVERLSPHAGH